MASRIVRAETDERDLMETLKQRTQEAINSRQFRETLENLQPPLNLGPASRVRLVRTLSRKFGPNFKSNPNARDVLRIFDEEASAIKTFIKLRRARDAQRRPT